MLRKGEALLYVIITTFLYYDIYDSILFVVEVVMIYIEPEKGGRYGSLKHVSNSRLKSRNHLNRCLVGYYPGNKNSPIVQLIYLYLYLYSSNWVVYSLVTRLGSLHDPMECVGAFPMDYRVLFI